MIKDECILVDEADRVTGHANKYQSHRWGGGSGGSVHWQCSGSRQPAVAAAVCTGSDSADCGCAHCGSAVCGCAAAAQCKYCRRWAPHLRRLPHLRQPSVCASACPCRCPVPVRAGLRRGSRKGCCTAPSQSSCLTPTTACCCSSAPPARSPSPASGPTPAAATPCMATAPQARAGRGLAGWVGSRGGPAGCAGFAALFSTCLPRALKCGTNCVLPTCLPACPACFATHPPACLPTCLPTTVQRWTQPPTSRQARPLGPATPRSASCCTSSGCRPRSCRWSSSSF